MPIGRTIRMLPRLAACAVFLVLATDASAQRRPARAPAQDDAPTFREEPYARGRGSDTYSVRPGHTGIITATTPNQYGNFGGPSNGSGGGGR